MRRRSSGPWAPSAATSAKYSSWEVERPAAMLEVGVAGAEGSEKPGRFLRPRFLKTLARPDCALLVSWGGGSEGVGFGVI